MDDSGFEGDVVIDNISDAIEAIETLVGATATAASLQGYTRLGDAAGKGLWVPVGLVAGLHPLYNTGFALWPFATSFTSVADGTTTAEGWRYQKVGAMVHDISRSTDVPSVAALHPMQNYSILVDCTTVDSSIAAGDHCFIEQKIEGFLWQQFYAQREWTVGFWHKHTKVGTYCVSLTNSGSDRSYVATYTQAVTDTWEYGVVNFAASPTAGTWNYTTGVGARLVFTLAGGSTFQTTPGSWQTGTFFSTSSQVNACDSTSNNFRLAAVQPALGTVAIPFAPRPYALDEILARRYRYVIGGGSANEVIGAAVCGGTTTSYWPMMLGAALRIAPTAIRLSAASDFQVLNGANTAFAVSAASLNTTYSGPNSAYITLTHATIGGAANDAVTVSAANSNARIAAEALL